MNLKETGTLLELVRGIWPSQQIGEDVARAWAWVLADVTAEEAGAAIKAIVSAGVSEFPPNPTRILAAARTLACNTRRIEEVTEASNVRSYKVGDRFYLGASKKGLEAYEAAMQQRGFNKVITGQRARSDGKQEVSFVFKKF